MSNRTAEKDTFPITAAQLSGNFCETLFFGIYLVTCAFCARTLFTTGNGDGERWRRPHEIRWMLTIIALVLFVICTFDTVLGLLHNFRAFIDSEDPEHEFRNIADWINIVRVSSNGSCSSCKASRIDFSLVRQSNYCHDYWGLCSGTLLPIYVALIESCPWSGIQMLGRVWTAVAYSHSISYPLSW